MTRRKQPAEGAADPGVHHVEPAPMENVNVASERIPSSDELELVLDNLIAVVESARRVPASASVMVHRDEVLAQLYDLRNRLPEELRAARWMLREREEFIDRTNREARGVMDQARGEAMALVSQEGVVREAQAEAERIIDAAQGRARQLRLEAEDYIDQRLASFETVLARTLESVGQSRGRLRHARMSEEESVLPADGEEA